MMRTPWACLRSPRGPRRENGWRRGPKPRSGAGQALEQQSRWRRSKREKPEEGGLSWKSKLESEDPHAPPTPDSVCAGPTRLQDRDTGQTPCSLRRIHSLLWFRNLKLLFVLWLPPGWVQSIHFVNLPQQPVRAGTVDGTRNESRSAQSPPSELPTQQGHQRVGGSSKKWLRYRCF